MSANLVSILASVVLLAFGIYKIWKTIELSRRKAASETWPVTMGEVISKKVTEHRNPKSGTSYYPDIKYKYSIMGQEFEKETRLGGIYSRKSAENALSNVGETIEVRYNPENPKDHITAQEKVNVFDILLIIVCLAISLFVLYRLIM
jgi:hypothetical protein